MGLYNSDNFIYHFAFGHILFDEGVEGKILIEPDAAESLLADGDHGVHNLKASKPVVESLKP